MFLDFPDVPDVLGVPSVPRFPSGLPTLANFTGSILNTTLSVSSMALGGSIYAGSVLNGSGLIDGTSVVQQLTGVAGGLGTYQLDTSQTFSGTIDSIFTPPDISGGDDEVAIDDAADLPQQDQPQWGIYKDGSPVVVADNVATVEFKQNFAISDYQVEDGGFQSYDKVFIPYDVRVRFSAGGDLNNRKALIESVDSIVGTLDLYDVVTPEKIYSEVNVVHQSLARAATDGVGLVKIDVWLEQVKADASATFSSTGDQKPISKPKGQAVTSTSQVNNGTVQASSPTTLQSAAFLNIGNLQAPRLQ